VNRAAGFKSGLRSAVLAAVTLGLMGGNIALAQAAGTLDPTFGSGGTVTTTFTGAGVAGHDTVQRPGATQWRHRGALPIRFCK
jgi:hypothetical protein